MAIDVRTICLGILSLGPATGYEIKKHVEEGPIGYFLEASYGAIYPALGRLTEEGLVACRTEHQESRPDRKIYSLTPAGKEAVGAALLEEPGPDRFRSEFMFLLIFADQMPREHLHALIDRRLEHYREVLDRLESAKAKACSPGVEFVRGLGETFFRAMIIHIEGNRHLLEARASSAARDAAE